MGMIVFDGTVFVVDRTATDGKQRWEEVNVWPTGTGEYVTGVGDRERIAEMRDWYLAGADPEAFPKRQRNRGRCTFLVVSASGLKRYDRTPVAIDHGRFACAFGMGAQVAAGALAMGADALEAAEIAGRFTGGSPLGFSVFSFEPQGTQRGRLDIN